MANQFSKVGYVIPQTYVDNLDAAVEYMWMRRDEFAGELGEFFEPIQADSTAFKMSSVSSVLGLVRESEDTADLPYDIPAPGYDKTFNLVNYRLAVRVTDTMVRADRQGKIMAMVQGLPKSIMRKKEYLRAAIFANAFTSGTGGDGQYLLANSHPHENPEAGTWDNLGTGALTYGNLQALRLLLDNMTNEGGYPDPVKGMTLVVPTALRQKAEELVGATFNPENALNQPVTLIKDLRIVVGHFLTSTTAYFLCGDMTGDNKGMYEVSLLDENLADCKPSDNPDIVWAKRAKMIWTCGFNTSKNITGSTGV